MGVLPSPSATSVDMGRPRYVENDDISVLNRDIGKHKDMVEMEGELQTKIVAHGNQQLQLGGLGT